MPMASSFGFAGTGRPLLYPNSLLDIAIALNQGSFARRFGVRAGPAWGVRVTKRVSGRP